jgi:hypothetical protein
MVTVDVPVAALLLAVSVRLLVVVAEAGLNEAVTPLGRPEADKLMLPKKPFCGVTVMVLDPFAPWTTVRLAGDAERLKLGAAPTVRETVVAWLRLPDVPVMVTVDAPMAAPLLTVTVRLLVVVAEAGLNDAVTPVGRPEADKLTLPLNPFWGAIVMALELEKPCAIVRLPGETERLKLGGAFTVSAIVVEWLRLPEVPVMVTVDVPVAAPLLAVSVRLLVVVAEAGLNNAVTPLGRPEADKLTLPTKPF